MRPNVEAVDLKALADESRPRAGTDLWRACTPLYMVMVAVAATACVVLLNLLLVGRLSFFFDLCFVVICLAAGLLVRPGEVWNVALLPPALMVGTVVFLALLSPATVAEADDSAVQAMITGVTNHAAALMAGYLVFGVALWTGNETAGVQEWDELEDDASLEPDDAFDGAEDLESAEGFENAGPPGATWEPQAQSSNLDGSPAPTRSTSG